MPIRVVQLGVTPRAKEEEGPCLGTVRSRLLDLRAALSNLASFAVGCYCEDESRRHRAMEGN